MVGLGDRFRVAGGLCPPVDGGRTRRRGRPGRRRGDASAPGVAWVGDLAGVGAARRRHRGHWGLTGPKVPHRGSPAPPGGRRPARAWRDGRAARAVVVACPVAFAAGAGGAQRTRTLPTRARPSSSSPSATHLSYVRSPTLRECGPASPWSWSARAPDRVGFLRATAGPAVVDHRAHPRRCLGPLPQAPAALPRHRRQVAPSAPGPASPPSCRRRPSGDDRRPRRHPDIALGRLPGRGAAADDGVLQAATVALCRARRRTPVGPSAPTGSPCGVPGCLLGAGPRGSPRSCSRWSSSPALLSLVAFVAFVRYVPAVQIEGRGARRAAAAAHTCSATRSSRPCSSCCLAATPDRPWWAASPAAS